MLAQELWVEVVVVHVRDEEVGGVADLCQVQMLVAGEREPRGEIRRVEPGVAEDTAVARLDEQACVADEGNLHEPSTPLPTNCAPATGRETISPCACSI